MLKLEQFKDIKRNQDLQIFLEKQEKIKSLIKDWKTLADSLEKVESDDYIKEITILRKCVAELEYVINWH